MTARTVLTVAALTLREASRRRVVWALLGMTAVLLALGSWGFSRVAEEFGGLGDLEARIAASTVLNLVMFGISLIAALGTEFLAGPTLAGEVESGISLAVLARPVRRSAVVVGKWLGLVVFGASFVVVAGLGQFLVVDAAVGYWPPHALTGLALLALQTTTLLTLALLLSTVISPMASGIVAVGLFGATWIAGVVGGLGAAFDNQALARMGDVSRLILPTDGLWRGAMSAFQHPALGFFLAEAEGFPFLGTGLPGAGYLLYAVAWVAAVLGLAVLTFGRRDL